jgi:regulator of protease activity HflC (stomatin/prohibitin superfamily)
MRKFNLVWLVVLVIFLMGNSSCTKIPPGYVGVKVNNMGSERGVQDYTLKTGLVTFMPILTSVFEWPTFVQTTVWTKNPKEGKPHNEEISFNTREGTSIQGDISLSYQLKAEKIPQFYVKFRTDDLETFTHGFLRNIARDAFNEVGSNFTLEEAYGVKKEEILKEIKKRINLEVNPYGVEIVQFGFVGALRMDPSIMAALNTKLTSIQNAIAAENQLRQAKAEAQKMIAKADGEAKSNELLAKSITPQLVQWRNLEITEKAVARWNGARPMVEGTGSGMLLQIPVGK